MSAINATQLRLSRDVTEANNNVAEAAAAGWETK